MYQNYKAITNRIEAINKELENINRIKMKYPEGELICAKNDSRYKWYLKGQGHSRYIPRDKKEYAEELALKKYYEAKRHDLICELEACEAYKKVTLQKEADCSDKILSHPEYSRLLSGKITSLSKEIEEWKNADYERNQNHPENLIIKGTEGKILRSKSEAFIDKVLFSSGIPFRYEEKLVIGGNVLYPDFTMIHPISGKLCYWEHFGMMDDPDYVNHACKKIGIYCENGIVPSINLILTFETQTHPFSISEAERIVQQYFLEN